ncbi:hypothetical protein SR870_12545 [Rhodopseudomonas palustris]|uniref:hypothetical protein n=1 Tax=Rhodopseudomonas palustris TaxID=1076 RepID=UPI002ACE8047|nr:hypothetical protein [Rhodopseudomonas palustris]WQG97548.1 hypothetical protein SR870_12545 [Rhodopseudomonas palustris]
MSANVAFLMYCGLIISVPALLIAQGAAAGGIVALFAAAILAIAAATSPSWDQSRLPRLAHPVILVGLAGAFLVMLVQIAPMSGGPLINPIWSSAAAAIGEAPTGSVTIDTGVTFLAICRLTSMVVIALLAVVLAQHRRDAERLLLVLTGIATVVSLQRLASYLPVPDSARFLPSAAQGAAETISVFGVVLTAATVIREYERARPSRSRPRQPSASSPAAFAVAVAALLVNFAAVISSGDPTTLFAAVFGASVVLAVLTIRKAHLSSWGRAGTAAVFALALATFIAFMPGRAESDFITRMTDDARLLGAGAGTLSALAPIYGEGATAPAASTAATLTIEMGRPFLWLTVLTAASWALLLLKGALQRGRDYVYAAAGAGCIAALLLSALSSEGGLSLAACVILSATLGLGLSHSKRETPPASAASAPLQSPAEPPDPRSFARWPHVVVGVAGLLLAGQGAWILLPEISRPPAIGFPSDQRHATVPRQHQDMALRSASLAAVRGDLWADAAFTHAGMLWTDPALELEAGDGRNAGIAASLLKALHYAPHRGDAWLMLASSCERLKLPACNVGALLKMSYYTAPDQAALLPLRLSQVLRLAALSGDDELADMARRDIRFVLTRSTELRPALSAAYRWASPPGRRLVEQTVTPLDPAYLKNLRAGSPRA